MNPAEITTLFLPPMACVKHLLLSEAAIKRCSTEQELPFSKGCKVAGFRPLITAAMCSIVDAAGFLDPPLAFTYRKNEGYFTLINTAISVHKVYIDF